MTLGRNPKLVIGACLALVVLTTAYNVTMGGPIADDSMVVAVERGPFAVTVTTSGELRAKESVDISGPPSARQVGLFQLRIASMVPEGTVVDSGEVVAELDRSQVASKLSEVSLALQRAEAVYEQAMLDSTLTLSQARDEIANLRLALEERRLAEEQAQYEPPTVRRQAGIDLERAQRALDQAQVDYRTKVEQARAKMREVGADLERQRNELAMVQGVMSDFTVRAPAPGMVIYVREWNGRKRTEGSQVSAWDPSVATLPDLSRMQSTTYVNEVDIRKVAVGQPVVVTLDSDPSKRLSGTVTSVANVGEQRPNSDAKVFEVVIDVEQQDTTLRPGMTTGNAIETARIDDVLFVPLEALASQDGIPIVYVRGSGGLEQREVVPGLMNDNYVILERGVEEGEQVLLVPPAETEGIPFVRLPDSPHEPSSDEAEPSPDGEGGSGPEQ